MYFGLYIVRCIVWGGSVIECEWWLRQLLPMSRRTKLAAPLCWLYEPNETWVNVLWRLRLSGDCIWICIQLKGALYSTGRQTKRGQNDGKRFYISICAVCLCHAYVIIHILNSLCEKNVRFTVWSFFFTSFTLLRAWTMLRLCGTKPN